MNTTIFRSIMSIPLKINENKEVKIKFHSLQTAAAQNYYIDGALQLSLIEIEVIKSARNPMETNR